MHSESHPSLAGPFLDANILLPSSFPGSLPADLLGELKKHAVLLTNASAKTGAERNVGTKMPERLAACQEFASAVEWVPLQLFDLDGKLAEKDRPIPCGAIAARADCLLTGDKGFRPPGWLHDWRRESRQRPVAAR